MQNRYLLAALAFFVASSGVKAGDSSGALWRVAQICTTNYSLTGLAFPCLEVKLPEDRGRGYAVLRPPYGAPDTILTPVRKTPGIEDPWLQSPEAPNYFSEAWKSIPLLASKLGRKPDPAAMGLAVNSAYTRSQDQMHIHLDCLAADVRRTLNELDPKITETAWTRLPGPLRGLSYLARRVSARDFERTNVFALVASGVPDARTDMAHITMVVTASSSARSPGYLVLAAKAGAYQRGVRPTGEDLLDHACRG